MSRPMHRRGAVAAVTAGLLAAATLVALPAGADVPEMAGLKAHGPLADHGFPTWYQDKTGLKLQPCLDGDDPLCGFAGEFVGQASFPDNFPDEMFYQLGGAGMAAGAVDVGLTMALEGAWANAIQDGDQVVFGRIRIRAEGLTPGATYRVTHPYGEDVFEATADDRNINFTEDVGVAQGIFTGALNSRIGPFLRWDEQFATPPEGYVGDPDQEARVIGSPYETNFFRIIGPGVGAGAATVNQCTGLTLPAGTNPVDCLVTDQFSITGKIATNSGVTPQQAHYTPNPGGDGGTVVVNATTDAGKALTVRHGGNPTIGRTTMHGEGESYIVKVPYSGATPPSSLEVANESDSPVARASIPVTDDVDISSVTWAPNAAGRLVLAVRATSSDPGAALTVQLPGGDVPVPADGIARALDLQAPPATVTVVSNKGGSEVREVQPTLATQAADPPTLMVAPVGTVIGGQRVTLDASGSTGSGTLAFEWRQVPVGNEPVLLTGVRRVAKTYVTPPAGFVGTLHFSLTVTDPVTGLSQTGEVPIVVDPPPVVTAPAVPADRINAMVGSTVTLDGSTSPGAVRWVWSQFIPTNQANLPGVAVTLAATEDNPVLSPLRTFVVPDVPATVPYLEFRLRVRDGNLALADGTAVVRVYPQRDAVAVTGAEWRGADEIRVDGTAGAIAQNTVTLTFRDSAGRRTVGLAVPVAVDGTWRYRGALPAAAAGSAVPTTTGLVVDAVSKSGGRVTGFPLDIR